MTYCPTCATEAQYKFNYVYQYKDHLGNIRLSYGYDEKDEVIKIIEENHYYPYGLKHTRYNSNEKKYTPDEDELNKMKLEEVPTGELGMNKYRFNGKEWQDELGLNMYAMDMRQYDPAIGRWVVQDPITHFSQTPYNGFDSNPVLFADPSGGNPAIADRDQLGRDRFNDYGLYVPVPDRGDGKSDNWKYEQADLYVNDKVDKDALVYQWLHDIGIDPNAKAPIDENSIIKILTSPEIQSYVKDAKYVLGVDLKIDLSYIGGKMYGETYEATDKPHKMTSYIFKDGFNTWARLALTVMHEAVHKIDYLNKKWILTSTISNLRTEVKAWRRNYELGDRIGLKSILDYQRQIDKLLKN